MTSFSWRSLVNGVRGAAAAGCVLAALAVPHAASAYPGMVPGNNPTPKLHVTGRFLQDPNGHNVLLHGWYQPAQSYFNGGGGNYPDPTDYTDPTNVAPALSFLEKEAEVLSNPAPQFGSYHGWPTSFVRINGSPGAFAPGWDRARDFDPQDATTNPTGTLTDPVQFDGWLRNLVVPYINYCRQRGLYVVIMGLPSETYPVDPTTHKMITDDNMSFQYQQNLIHFWTAVANFPGIKSADNVQFEICNEPVKIESSFGAGDWDNDSDTYYQAITNFMQPVVDAIRQQNADNIIWVPGLGYQGQYEGFVAHPVTGGNIGYAAHFYPGYVGRGLHNSPFFVSYLWNSHYKACADHFPMMITELWWQNYIPAPVPLRDYSDLFYARTGNAYTGFGWMTRHLFDAEQNVSYLVGFSSDLLGNLDQAQGGNNMAAVTLPTTDGAQAAFRWFNDYNINGWGGGNPLAPVGPADGTYIIKPADDARLAVDVSGGLTAPGTRIDQNRGTGISSQTFHFHDLGNNQYWLEPANAPGMAVDVLATNPVNGAGLDITSYVAGTVSQIWDVMPTPTGNYRISSDYNPSQTLDQPNASIYPDVVGASNPLNLQMYTWFNTLGQRWNLTAH